MMFEDEDGKDSPRKTKFPLTLFISEGNKYLRLFRFDEAISAFERVLHQDPNNIQAHLGKAKCYIKLAKYKEAWYDLQHVIQLNPKCAEAVYLKGATEYLRGNFEESFITYWKGYKLRPSCDDLRKGYEMCKEAIDNSLNAETLLWLTSDDIKGISKMNFLFQSSTQKSDIKGTYDTTGIFSVHLKLLDDILKDKSLISVHSLCKELFDYLTKRQKFWKMQSPQVKTSTFRPVKNYKYDLLKINHLKQNFEICKAFLNDGKTKICRKKCQEVLEALSLVLYECFPEKTEMEAEILQYLGLAYFKEGDLSSALKIYEELLTFAVDNNLTEVEGKALQNIGEIYYEDHKFERAAGYFETIQEFLTSESNEAIVLYKLSDCYTHLNHLDQARKTAVKCWEITIKTQDYRFRLDVLLLLAEIAVKEKNMEIAERYFSNALELAIQSHDTRQKDIEGLLLIFNDIAGKECYSAERFKIVELTQVIKHAPILGNVS